MTPTLTDADRETIAAIYGNDALYKAETPMGFHFYLAGLAAGMERAAKVCEGVYREGDWSDGVTVARKCAAAIREQAK